MSKLDPGMSKHTPTPWEANLREGVWSILARDRRDTVCFFCAYGRGQGHPDLIAEATANADRIVACTNAFHSSDGREIATEKIEEGLFWKTYHAAADVLEIANGYIEEYGPTLGEEGEMERAYIKKLENLLNIQGDKQ